MARFSDSTNYFILAKEYEYGQTCVLVHNAGQKYLIQQGVHRTAAARDIGMQNIRANINAPDGKILSTNVEVPIVNLHSPRDVLVPERYVDNLSKMITTPQTMRPIEVMPITKPRHVSIMDVH